MRFSNASKPFGRISGIITHTVSCKQKKFLSMKLCLTCFRDFRETRPAFFTVTSVMIGSSRDVHELHFENY